MTIGLIANLASAALKLATDSSPKDPSFADQLQTLMGKTKARPGAPALPPVEVDPASLHEAQAQLALRKLIRYLP